MNFLKKLRTQVHSQARYFWCGGGRLVMKHVSSSFTRCTALLHLSLSFLIPASLGAGKSKLSSCFPCWRTYMKCMVEVRISATVLYTSPPIVFRNVLLNHSESLFQRIYLFYCFTQGVCLFVYSLNLRLNLFARSAFFTCEK